MTRIRIILNFYSVRHRYISWDASHALVVGAAEKAIGWVLTKKLLWSSAFVENLLQGFSCYQMDFPSVRAARAAFCCQLPP